MIQPEKDDGNIEYKLKLINKNTDKIEHLESQMRYRLNEGNGEAIYIIGVTDNGIIVGVTDDDFKFYLFLGKKFLQYFLIKK